MNRILKHCLGAAVAVLMIAGSSASFAAYPERPIRLITPFPPGNATDAVARAAARKLEEALKQPVVVDNRPGAGGSVGSEIAAKAPPDGYTLLVGSSASLAINPGLYSKLPYKPLRDFEPIAQLLIVPLFLAVNNHFPAKTAAEFVRIAKGKPGSISYGSNGNATSTHLMMESFRRAQGIELVHVPYKGSGPAMMDLVGGQIQAAFDTGTTLLPLAKEGKVRILAVASKTRNPAAPEIPTVAESGLGDFNAPAWVGLVAPKGTPREILDTLHQALRRTWLSPDVRASMNALGGETVFTTPAEFGAHIADEIAKWGAIIKQSGAQVD